MNRNQPSKEIFKELFKLFDKYGDNLILYCHSKDSNNLACNLSGTNKLEKQEMELLENLRNILGRNHLDKLHKLKFTYEKYKKDGKGAIKFAFSDGEKFFMSLEEIMHGNNGNIIVQKPVIRKDTGISNIGPQENKISADSKISDDMEDTTDSDDSDDSDDTDFILGGKKSIAKKSKKKAKKKMKKTPAGLAAKESKKQAKLAKKKASMTPEGRAAKEARNKLKKIKKTGTEDEIREAKVAAKAAKKAARMTPEGQEASLAKKRAKEAKKAMKSTPEAQAYKEAKIKARGDKASVEIADGEDIHVNDKIIDRTSERETPMRFSALKNTLKESIQQGIEQAEEQIIDDVSRTAADAMSGTISGITDRLRRKVIPQERPNETSIHNTLEGRELENVVPFLEKMFRRNSEQTSELTGMISTAIQNDNKIISLLEKISAEAQPVQQLSATSPDAAIQYSETSRAI